MLFALFVLWGLEPAVLFVLFALSRCGRLAPLGMIFAFFIGFSFSPPWSSAFPFALLLMFWIFLAWHHHQCHHLHDHDALLALNQLWMLALLQPV